MENIAELPATQVTAGQLADLIISRLATQKEEDPSRKYVRGLDSLAKLLQVSTSTIARYKKKGIFGDAIKQNGKYILVDVKLAQERFFFQKDETTLTSLPAYGLIAPVTHKQEESTYNKNSPTRYHSG